jgi:hypothetical protein
MTMTVDIKQIFGGKSKAVDPGVKSEQPRLNAAQIEKLHVKLFDNLVTLDELVAGMKGLVSKGTVYNWISSDEMPEECYRKFGRRLLFNPDKVALWIQRRAR